MTLLVRQMAAAFWFALLLPILLTVTVQGAGGKDPPFITVLSLYSVAAFLLAWRLFFLLQDTGWTGGVIALNVGDSSPAEAGRREHRPWAALFWKELQLQQITFVGMACLVVLHLGTIALRRVGAQTYSRTALTALETMAGLWLFVPLITGAQSVAEERKLGMMGWILCLPRSRRGQWFLKLTVVLAIGALSATLCWLPEHFWGEHNLSYNWLLPIFLGVALLGFYGSSLTNGVVQGMAAAMLTLLFLSVGLGLPASGPAMPYVRFLWVGALPLLVGVPMVVATLFWLSYRNFQNVSESAKLWRRNAFSLTAALVASWSLTSAIYYRPWELLTPAEPSHGAARIAIDKPTAFDSAFDTFAVILPNGRLWTDHFNRASRWNFLGFHGDETLRSIDGGQFASGSNWLAIAATPFRILAIRADGTLWVSERLTAVDNRPETFSPLAQFEGDSNWLSVAKYASGGMVLLKREGTLWNWGNPDMSGDRARIGLPVVKPYQIGHDSDWSRLLGGGPFAYAWKTNGSAWGWRMKRSETQSRRMQEELVRLPTLGNARWRTVGYWMLLRDDGTLWHWDDGSRGSADFPFSGSVPVQVGLEANWADVALWSGGIIARKTDGSLWKWAYNFHRAEYFSRGALVRIFSKPPVRFGAHSDWVALANMHGMMVSLAADGSLWSWPDTGPVAIGYRDAQDFFLIASRKPTLVENILGAGK